MASANGFPYDTLDRLTHAVYLGDQNDNEVFTYDALGNRTNVNLRNGTDEVYYLANPNLNNEYTTIGVNSLTHDAAGNMTECNLDYTYEYDYENHLNKITKNSSTKAEYTYDALGRRIEKIAGGVTTRYYYDGWRVLTEVEGSNSKDFVYGNYLDEVLIMIDPSGDDHYYAHDHLFSPVALIADDGTVEERYEYDAYGKMTRLDPDFTAWSGTPAGNPYCFTGQRLDELNGGSLLIMYYKNRYYLPDIGRFIQRDPLGVNDGLAIVYFADNGSPKSKSFNPFGQYTDGMSLFEYVKSNPIQYQDSHGMIADNFPGPIPELPDDEAEPIYYEARGRTRSVWDKKHNCIREFYVYGHGAGTSEDEGTDKKKDCDVPPEDYSQTVGPRLKEHDHLNVHRHIPSGNFCCATTVYLCGCYIGNNTAYMKDIAGKIARRTPHTHGIVSVCGCTGEYKVRWWLHDRHGWCDGEWKCVSGRKKGN